MRALTNNKTVVTLASTLRVFAGSPLIGAVVATLNRGVEVGFGFHRLAFTHGDGGTYSLALVDSGKPESLHPRNRTTPIRKSVINAKAWRMRDFMERRITCGPTATCP
jgi:hypothetical protein